VTAELPWLHQNNGGAFLNQPRVDGPRNELTAETVATALELGYRSIHTAAFTQ
jgi:diketogulonate reductase-like aldo/keto reductase